MKNTNSTYFALRRLRGGNPQELTQLLRNSIGNSQFIDSCCYDKASNSWNLKYLFWMTKGIYGIYLNGSLTGVAYVYVQDNRHYLGVNVQSGYQQFIDLPAVQQAVTQLSLYCYQIDDLRIPNIETAKITAQVHTSSFVA